MSSDVSVMVCRGCCCGTVALHPGTDSDAHLARIRGATGPHSIRLYTTNCLGPCEHSNVVVVRTGAVRRWFGGMLDDRDVGALADWLGGGADVALPARLAARQFDPSDAASIMANRVPVDAACLADLMEAIVRQGIGGWTIGVEGAAAELTFEQDPPSVRRYGPTIECVGRDGGLRLRVSPDAAAFTLEVPGTGAVVALILAVPRASLREPATTFTWRGSDGDSLRVGDRSAQSFDLGIGQAAASFCVRTTDPDLLELLHQHAGMHWRDVLDRVGPRIVECSPHRVVATAAGRAEVYSPIPPPGGTSSKGSHTHLLPAELEVGHELPTIMRLPAGWAPTALFHPPPAWQLPTPARR